MRIAITGASGLIGSAITKSMRSAGHAVTRLVRSREAAAADDAAYWRPSEGEIDGAALEGHDVVIHLAGENLFGLWTGARKRRIRESRIRGTDLLARTLAGLTRKPATLLSASAIGIYGDRGGEVLDESASPGQGFLAETGLAWEAATRPAEAAGVRVVHMRQGVVLSPGGGALRIMLPIFRLGIGGPIGSGEQYLPWIALEEIPPIVTHLIEHTELRGPVNVVAPEQVTFRQLSDGVAAALHRPAPFFVPAAIARLVAGEMAEEVLLSSARVTPARLDGSGYEFRWPRLEPALRHMIGRD